MLYVEELSKQRTESMKALKKPSTNEWVVRRGQRGDDSRMERSQASRPL